LVEDDRPRPIEHFRRDLEAAVRWKAVHENSFGGSKRHELGIHLVGLENFGAHILFGFKAHAGPRIGVDSHRAGDGFARIVHQFDFRFRLASDALAVGNHFRRRRVIWRCGDAEMNAEASGEIHQGMADVVAVADVGQLETAQHAKTLLKGKEISERLAGMEFVGKGVDHRNAGVGGHLFENALRVDAGDDAVDPAVEIARDIGDRFALAERGRGLRVIEEDHGSAHALNADIEGDAGAERGLLENQGDEFAVQRRGVTDRAGLDIGREVKELTGVRGTPFGSGEEIVR
jgi:hypothetical protein